MIANLPFPLSFVATILFLSPFLLLVTGADYGELRDDLRHFESIHDFELRVHVQRAPHERRRLSFKSFHHNDGLRAAGYPQNLELSFYAFGKQRILTLQKHIDLFAQSYSEVRVLPNGTFAHRPKNEHALHCLYHGLVDGDVYSKALVSLCNQQLHATVLAEDSSFEIQHLPSNRSHKHEYIAYKLSDYIPMDNATCGGAHVPSAEQGSDHTSQSHVHSHEHRVGMRPSYSRRRLKKNICTQKYVEIVVINDLKQYENRGETVEHITALAFSNMRSLYDNIYDKRFFKFCIKARMVGQITYRSRDPSAFPSKLIGHKSETDINHKLSDFTKWVYYNVDDIKGLFNSKTLDNVILVHGGDFTETSVGLAWLSTMCSFRLGGNHVSVSVVQGLTSSSSIGSVMAHELGHNFGLRHVKNDPYAIMSPIAPHGEQGWSTLSKKSFSKQIANYKCLDNNPGVADWNSPFCGNGMLDEGEECDTGLGIIDSCCNMDMTLASVKKVCSFSHDCECANSDGCCRDGKIMKAGENCRLQQSLECDIPEKCDGKSSRCPRDRYHKAGLPCQNGGLCFKGACMRTATKQQCFDKFSGFKYDIKPSINIYSCERKDAPCTYACCEKAETTIRSYFLAELLATGTPCTLDSGGKGQCFADETGKVDAQATARCVESADLRIYNWEDCSTCKDEIGDEVDPSLCPEDPPPCLDTTLDCTPNPCTNAGLCTDRGNYSYACICVNGWEGKNCEYDIDDCERDDGTDQCNLQGVCHDQGVNSFRCDCDPGWGGMRCDQDIDDCCQDPCAHGSMCVDTGPQQFECKCREHTEWTLGPRCDISAENFVEFSPGNCLCSSPLAEFLSDFVRDCADACLAHPSCAAFGFGTGLIGQQQCLLFPEACTSPCENPTEERSRVIFNLATNTDDCSPNPCGAGSSKCTDIGIGSFACECSSGWHGPTCSSHTAVDDCEPSPCEHGSCVDIGHSYNCTCDTGWEGVTCATDVNECERSPCLNGGRCIDHVNGSYTCDCSCAPAYGADCGTRMPATNPSYKSVNASTSLSESTTAPPGDWVDDLLRTLGMRNMTRGMLYAVMGVGGALLIIAIICCCTFCCCRGDSRRRSSNHPDKQLEMLETREQSSRGHRKRHSVSPRGHDRRPSHSPRSLDSSVYHEAFSPVAVHSNGDNKPVVVPTAQYTAANKPNRYFREESDDDVSSV